MKNKNYRKSGLAIAMASAMGIKRNAEKKAPVAIRIRAARMKCSARSDFDGRAK